MNVNSMFKRKSPGPRVRVGATQLEAATIKEFTELMEPLGQKATEYFRSFQLNGGAYRVWLLPSHETWQDLPIDKQRFVLRYKDWFVGEISKQELDELKI